MKSLIDALHANAAIKDVDLIDRAWLLGDPPIRREGLIEKLQEQGSIDAVVPDKDDGLRFGSVAFQHEAKRVGSPGHKVLQRIALGETHEMRCRMPSGKEFWPCGPDLVKGPPLPPAVVKIDKRLYWFA